MRSSRRPDWESARLLQRTAPDDVTSPQSTGQAPIFSQLSVRSCRKKLTDPKRATSTRVTYQSALDCSLCQSFHHCKRPIALKLLATLAFLHADPTPTLADVRGPLTSAHSYTSEPYGPTTAPKDSPPTSYSHCLLVGSHGNQCVE